jgi:hypothetical protein
LRTPYVLLYNFYAGGMNLNLFPRDINISYI